jgi:hypothetical protein
MTRAAPDWLLELRNARAAGFDAIALFRGVEPSVIVDAITDCEIRILPVGATLLRPGESNDTIYVLLSGQLAAYLDGARRPETGIPIHPGESVGEMSAIDGKPTSAFVVAVTESRLLLLPASCSGAASATCRASRATCWLRYPRACAVATRQCWRHSGSSLVSSTCGESFRSRASCRPA